MSKECFCGCGREIPFGRKRIGNVLGDRMRLASRASAQAASAPDPLDRLRTLSEVRQTGALTDDEFTQQKTRILEDV